MNGEKMLLHQMLEQKRSALAWNLIKKVKKEVKDRDFETKYRAWVEKIPVMIMNNGLGQSLAFLKSKPSDAEKKTLYNHIAKWLFSKEVPLKWVDNEGNELPDRELIECVQKTTSTVYLQATQEALKFVVWLKRYAGAMLKKER